MNEILRQLFDRSAPEKYVVLAIEWIKQNPTATPAEITTKKAQLATLIASDAAARESEKTTRNQLIVKLQDGTITQAELRQALRYVFKILAKIDKE